MSDQQDRKRRSFRPEILIPLWLIVEIVFILKGMYMTAGCFLYGVSAAVIKMMLQDTDLRNLKLFKWIFTAAGALLLVLVFRFCDPYPYSQLIDAVIVIIGWLMAVSLKAAEVSNNTAASK